MELRQASFCKPYSTMHFLLFSLFALYGNFAAAAPTPAPATASASVPSNASHFFAL
jgi:hypothetical protein